MYTTVVEVEVKAGAIANLNVTGPERAKDVIIVHYPWRAG